MNRSWMLVALASLVLGNKAIGQTPKDVPVGHWARSAVTEVVATGVMTAPNGKFQGGAKVSRRELSITVAKLAKSLERGDWAKKTANAVKSTGDTAKDEQVTRYVLASVINKVARIIGSGLPKPTGKAYLSSVVLPQTPPDIKMFKSDPAYESLSFLSKNRMLSPKSVLLKPGPEPVTAMDLRTAITAMVAGLNDRLTDEPQNREDIGMPPGHKH